MTGKTLLVVLGVIVLSLGILATELASDDGAMTVEISGVEDQLPPEDADTFGRFNSAIRDWNAAFDPVVRDLNDPLVDAPTWVGQATTATRDVTGSVQRMQTSAAEIEHDGLRALALDRADVYAEQLAAFSDLVRAISAGDLESERSARERLVSITDEGQQLARGLIDALHAIEDAYDER